MITETESRLQHMFEEIRTVGEMWSIEINAKITKVIAVSLKPPRRLEIDFQGMKLNTRVNSDLVENVEAEKLTAAITKAKTVFGSRKSSGGII